MPDNAHSTINCRHANRSDTEKTGWEFTGVVERKVDSQYLKTGMYVSRLDRPWIETPFPFQGFYIRAVKDIQRLQRYCRFVYIDTERGAAAARYLRPDDDRAVAREVRAICSNATIKSRYRKTESFESELQMAREQHSKLRHLVRNVMDDVRAGRKIGAVSVRHAVAGMIESILRNPDAFLWLARLKEADTYTYDHAIGCCTLAVAFGRHLGFSKADLMRLAVGTLLFDIGKMKLPQSLFSHSGPLSQREFELMKEHVGYSVELMQETKGMDPVAIDIAMHHHERHDGSGYPGGLSNGQIPVYGQIAGLVDCYDAITSDRPHQPALSPHAAVNKLYQWRNVDFQDALVEQFIQCLGVYPTGTIVELTNGQVGIVLVQNKIRRLRPKVMLVLDANKDRYDIAPTVDLMTENEDNDGAKLEIKGALSPGAYGIDPKEFYI